MGENLHGAYNLGSEVAAYNFDQAVWIFGISLQQALDEVEAPKQIKDEKVRQRTEEDMRTRVLNNWLPKVSDAEPEAKPATAFADPAKRF